MDTVTVDIDTTTTVAVARADTERAGMAVMVTDQLTNTVGTTVEL